ncbi:beta-galactosidase small subunit [Paenibacillus alkalitolerans]|uniref:beta-galactosidase small subunit n=1 Tax=Paenibacillus alkalitolerans TaxID=2799335 RepID=UPI0018F7983D|nr:beta-galactosidase small subunit [Paenibacillus alkalitolerans]
MLNVLMFFLQMSAIKGKELIKRPPAPNFWRAPTDNDRGSKLPVRCATWKRAGENGELAHFNVEISPYKVRVKAEYMLATASPSICSVTYTVFGNGEIGVVQRLQPGQDLPEIPEVGMMFAMDRSFDNFSWFGKGPHENYCDRATGAKLGIYEGKAAEQFVPYLKPQECGNKTEVRWAEITDSDGDGLLIRGCSTVEVNVLPYTPSELEAHDHAYKLPPSDKTVVRVNCRQMGVGGDDSWHAKTHPEFTLYADRTYEYSYIMESGALRQTRQPLRLFFRERQGIHFGFPHNCNDRQSLCNQRFFKDSFFVGFFFIFI